MDKGIIEYVKDLKEEIERLEQLNEVYLSIIHRQNKEYKSEVKSLGDLNKLYLSIITKFDK